MKKIILFAALFVSIGLFAAPNAETVSHRIQPKETLFKISLMYNSTVSDILKANPGIDAKTVKAGATIKVPKDTKIRDAAFVESFLNSKQDAAPSAQAPKAVSPRPTSITMSDASADAKLVFTPISQIATQVKTEKAVESKPIVAAAPVQAQMDENPFLTPSEPRTGPIADEQPVKDEKAIEPASASNGDEADENPFMAPKHKSDGKPAAKNASKITSSTE